MSVTKCKVELIDLGSPVTGSHICSAARNTPATAYVKDGFWMKDKRGNSGCGSERRVGMKCGVLSYLHICSSHDENGLHINAGPTLYLEES